MTIIAVTTMNYPLADFPGPKRRRLSAIARLERSRGKWLAQNRIHMTGKQKQEPVAGSEPQCGCHEPCGSRWLAAFQDRQQPKQQAPLGSACARGLESLGHER